MLCALILTISLASLSWIFFEKPLVRLGHSFKYSSVRSAPLRPNAYNASPPPEEEKARHADLRVGGR